MRVDRVGHRWMMRVRTRGFVRSGTRALNNLAVKVRRRPNLGADFECVAS
jgi:hypothetical protein